MFFRRVDSNANDELDAHELQQFAHDIEPEEAVPDVDHIVHIMQHTMKHVADKQGEPFTISWQQFRQNYPELDTVAERNAPQVRFFYYRFVRALFALFLANPSVFACWRYLVDYDSHLDRERRGERTPASVVRSLRNSEW